MYWRCSSQLVKSLLHRGEIIKKSRFRAPCLLMEPRGFAASVGAKADVGGPVTRDISAGGTGLSTPARSSSLGPTHLAGGLIPFERPFYGTGIPPLSQTT